MSLSLQFGSYLQINTDCDLKNLSRKTKNKIETEDLV